MNTLVDHVALAIATHFRGDKQPPMDPKQAIALFEGAAGAAIEAQKKWEIEYLNSLSEADFYAVIDRLHRMRIRK